MQFSQIIGHDDIKQRLIRQVRDNRVAHAQLFHGPEGVGKLQLAIAYAQYIACQDKRGDDSCGVCPACVKYAKLQHPDLHFVFPIVKPKDRKTVVCDDFIYEFRNLILERGYFTEADWYAYVQAESKSGVIYAHESTEILKKLSLKSYESEHKVMIIWLPEKMNITCANKILKLLEEPEGKTLFLLVSNAPDQIITTILSRTQQVKVSAIEQPTVSQALVSKYGITPEQAQYYARVANGSYAKALGLMGQSDDKLLNFHRFTEMMRMAWMIGNRSDYASLLKLSKWTDEIASTKVGREQQKAFFRYAQYLTRENFIYNLANPDLNYLNNEEQSFSANFARFVNERNVEDMMEEFGVAERQIEQNGNAKMIFFDVALKMIMLLKR